MAFKDLLVHLDSGSRAPERLALAVALARRHGARLTGLFAESSVLGQSLVGRRAPESVDAAARETKALFDFRVAEARLQSRWWRVEVGEYADVVGATIVCCRYVDLAVFGQQEGDDSTVPEGVVERVIAESGRPVLVVPSAGRYADVGRNVLVAWTGSRESARALNDALPLLEEADEVTLLAIQLPAAGGRGGLPSLDVVEHLRSHGIEARYERAVLHDLPAVDLVLNRASDLGSDLTVMGAYGVQGAPLLLRRDTTTRSILATMTTPMFLTG
jgi:nucleotide-binding universal stress UspA family protein